jgi:hypothetical protein
MTASFLVGPNYWLKRIIMEKELAKHQLLEIENDLIAAHIIQTGNIPDIQFLG